MRRSPAGPYSARSAGARLVRGSAGTTLIELLVAGAIFVVLLGALGAMLTTSLTAYRVTSQQSEVLQDVESVEQLLRFELGRAGFRGTGETEYLRSFDTCSADWPSLGSGAGCATLIIERLSDALSVEGVQDAVTVRFFEDGRFVAEGDDCDGERAVTYAAAVSDQSLQRIQRDCKWDGTGSTVDVSDDAVLVADDLLVGSVERLIVTELIDRQQLRFDVDVLLSNSSAARPRNLGAIAVSIVFQDGRETDYVIGFNSPQAFVLR